MRLCVRELILIVLINLEIAVIFTGLAAKKARPATI